MSWFKEFSQLVAAERFPQTIQWQAQDYFALALLPVIFTVPLLLQSFFSASPMTLSIVDVALRTVIFALICVVYRDVLVRHWIFFRRGAYLSWLIVVVGGIALQLCISGVRSLLPVIAPTEVMSLEELQPGLLALFLLSFGPVFTALIEDTVFRYTLLQKLYVQGFLWRTILVCINSILFGLIHYNNFDGNLLATCSFMAAGLFLNLVYLWTRNLWHVLLIHLINNAVLAWGGLLLLALFKAMSLD